MFSHGLNRFVAVCVSLNGSFSYVALPIWPLVQGDTLPSPTQLGEAPEDPEDSEFRNTQLLIIIGWMDGWIGM